MKLLLIMLAFGWQATASAQDADQTDVAALEQVSVPVLLSQPPVNYPATALAEGETAAVLLRLVIDTEGRVVDATVDESAGDAFDESAILASLQFIFEPARTADKDAVAVEILYRYVFSVQEVVVPAEETNNEQPSEQQSSEVDTGGIEVLVVKRRLPTNEVTERILDVQDIRYLPGTGGDVVKVVQNLPGVGRSPLGTGNLIIRGTAPEDSGYFFDGAEIPTVFHFSGLTTVVTSESLQEVAFLPGSFSVRYGRVLGGLVDLRLSPSMPQQNRNYLSVDVYQATAFSEIVLGKKDALQISGRRSYIDVVLNPILNSGTRTVQAPRYYDFQARWLHETNRGDMLDIYFLLSDDSFRFIGPEEEGSVLQTGFGTEFQKLRVQYRQEFENDWRGDLTLFGGPESKEFSTEGAGLAYEKPLVPSLRYEVSRTLTDDHMGWNLGTDTMAGVDSYLFDVPSFGPKEEGSSYLFMPGLYAEGLMRLGRTDLSLGSRMDALAFEDGFIGPIFDPRVSMKTKVWKGGAIKAATGRHSQFPETRQLLAEGDGNPDLGAKWALQSSLGLEQEIGSISSIEVVGFYHQLYDLVSGREDVLRFFTGPPDFGPFDTDPYANDGVGRTYGIEALWKLQTGRSIALVSATFSRSERQDRPDSELELFKYDQPVVLTAIGSREMGRSWRMGGRVRFSSGYPYTPVVNSFYDLSSRQYIPVFGDKDSARLPDFFALDVRFDKEWVYDRWTLTTYLDIQNLTNTVNPEVISWSYDYEVEEPVTSNPFLPAFGIKGEW